MKHQLNEIKRMQQLAGVINEELEFRPASIQDTSLYKEIYNAIASSIYLRDTKYGDGDQELDPDSIDDTVKQIMGIIENIIL